MYDPDKKIEYRKPIKSILPGEYVALPFGKRSKVIHCGVSPECTDCIMFPANFFNNGIPSEDLYMSKHLYFASPGSAYGCYIRGSNFDNIPETEQLPLYYIMLENMKDFFDASGIFILPMTFWPSKFVDNSLVQTDQPQTTIQTHCQTSFDIDFQKSSIDEFAPAKPVQKQKKLKAPAM